MSRRFAAYLLVAAAILTASCKEPLRQSCFRNVSSPGGWKVEDTLKLQLDLRAGEGDMLNICALAEEKVLGEQIRLYLQFISPSGHVYPDTANLRFEKTEGVTVSRKGSYVQFLWPYMKIGKLNMEGSWTILMQRDLKDNPAYSGISGMGVSVSSKDNR